jgi:hypothetical protein
LIIQLGVDKSVNAYITFLLMSDAKKEVEEAKNNELKGQYRFVLMQDIEAVDKYVMTKTSEYTYASIFVHMPWHISDFALSWM